MVYYAIAIAFSNGVLSDKNIFFIKKKKKNKNKLQRLAITFFFCEIYYLS